MKTLKLKFLLRFKKFFRGCALLSDTEYKGVKSAFKKYLWSSVLVPFSNEGRRSIVFRNGQREDYGKTQKEAFMIVRRRRL